LVIEGIEFDFEWRVEDGFGDDFDFGKVFDFLCEILDNNVFITDNNTIF
jgi:hypothetical protein